MTYNKKKAKEYRETHKDKINEMTRRHYWLKKAKNKHEAYNLPPDAIIRSNML